MAVKSKRKDNIVGLFALDREMGFTEAEFMNLLPKALTRYNYHIDGHHITVSFGDGTATIDIGEERERVLSPFVRLALLPVRIAFHGVNTVHQRQFMARFDAVYMKGLG